MNRQRPPGPLTVAELVHSGPLGRAHLVAAPHLDQQVTGVSLISDLAQARRCAPNTALVVHPAAAPGVWALESALRFAWERNASCVVAPSEISVTDSTKQLAERLRVPLFTVDDPAEQALELAATIADTEAVRCRLTARCAVLLGERHRPQDIVAVINNEVPGVRVVLVTPDGHTLAGRVADNRPAGGPHQVRVPVPGPDGRPWAELVAHLATPSPSWVQTVETILKVARAPLAAAIAHAQLSSAHQASKDRLLLEALLHGKATLPKDPRAPHSTAGRADVEQIAREAGWRLDGTHVAVCLRPLEREVCALDAITPGIVATWHEAFPQLPLVPMPRGWVTWFTGESAEPALLADLIRRRLAGVRIPISLATGIGQPATGLKGLRQSVAEADLAAEVAGRSGESSVELYGELGPRVVLARLPLAEIADAALVLLADLAADPRTDVLVETLSVLLDCAGSTGQAASRLGVHRNTVLGRIERIRACGVDPDAPEQRLALHIACYALRSTRPWK